MAYRTHAEAWEAERKAVARRCPECALPGVRPAEEPDSHFLLRVFVAAGALMLIGWPLLRQLGWL